MRKPSEREVEQFLDDLERETDASSAEQMTPEEWAAAYIAGDVDAAVPPDADPDDGAEWIYLRVFGTEDENIGGIRVPVEAIPDCFDPDEDFPV